jgi:hypothetical protein
LIARLTIAQAKADLAHANALIAISASDNGKPVWPCVDINWLFKCGKPAAISGAALKDGCATRSTSDRDRENRHALLSICAIFCPEHLRQYASFPRS